jgi:hypothetical protein
VTWLGVIEDESGQVVDLHAKPATLTASVRDAFVDDSFELAPGRYTATAGIAEDGTILAMTKTELTIEGLDPAGTGISELILSNHAYPLPEGQLPTDPYAFGGLKFVPKGDLVFEKSDSIWYFFELRTPGLGDAGAPKVQVKVNFDGKSAESRDPVRFELPFQEIETIKLKDLEGRYGLGMAFPLKDFQPGKYTVKLRVIDTVLRESYEAERTIEVR